MPSINSYLDKIQQLRSALEVNISCCETILGYINSKKDNPLEYTKLINTPIGAYLVLVCNNHFYEAISVLNSLLFPQKSEVSPYVNLSLTQLQREELDIIKSEFKEKGMQDLRHNVIDHKSDNVIINPLILSIFPIDENYFKEVKAIFDKFTTWMYNSFNVLTTYANPVGIRVGLQRIINKLEIKDMSDEKL